MKSLIFAASAVVLAAASPAFAQTAPEWYGTAGYAATDADSVNLGAIQGRIGVKLNPYVGFEGEAAIGVKEDDVTVGATNVNVKLNHEVAAFVVGYLPVSPSTDLFVRAGYGSSEIEASAAGTSFSGSDSGLVYGVGGQHYFTDKDGVRVDWTKHEFDGGGDANVWAVAYTRKF